MKLRLSLQHSTNWVWIPDLAAEGTPEFQGHLYLQSEFWTILSYVAPCFKQIKLQAPKTKEMLIGHKYDTNLYSFEIVKRINKNFLKKCW